MARTGFRNHPQYCRCAGPIHCLRPSRKSWLLPKVMASVGSPDPVWSEQLIGASANLTRVQAVGRHHLVSRWEPQVTTPTSKGQIAPRTPHKRARLIGLVTFFAAFQEVLEETSCRPGGTRRSSHETPATPTPYHTLCTIHKHRP